MKQFKKLVVLTLASAFFLTSCSSDDDAIALTQTSEPLASYENGYFVINEGNGSSITSSITYVGENGVKTDDVFRIENPDADEIGIYIQSIFFDDTRAYIIAGSGSVTVVDRYSFEYIATVSTDLENPRYGVVANGKAYITNTAGYVDGSDDFLTVIDLSNYSTTQIIAGDFIDKITFKDDNVIIANGSFGNGNAISILDTNSGIMESIDLGAGNSPNSIEVKGNYVYALTGSGKFMEIDLGSNVITNTLDLPTSITGIANLDIVNTTAYFTSEASVYAFNIGDATVSTTPILTYNSNSDFGVMYGFAVNNDVIYIGDGADFSSNGTFYEYSTTGALLNSFDAGIGPNGFYFN